MADASETAGDFARFYEATLAPLRRFLFRMMGDRTEAQDLAHDAYARTFTAMQGKEVGRPQAFLYMTARNLALDQLKRRGRAPFDLASAAANDDAAASTLPGIESVVMAREEWALMQEAVGALPPGCRRALLLRTVEGLSHEEIAERLGLARSSVEKHLMRAVRLLHEAMRRTEETRNAEVLPIETKTGSGGRRP